MTDSKASKGIRSIPRKKKNTKPAGISEKLIRLLEIYQLIDQKHYPNIQSLKERFSVSERTVYRYVELIGMVEPVEMDKGRGGYAFIGGARAGRPLLTDDELMVLLAAGEAVSHLGGSLKENFRHLVERITITGRGPAKRKPPIIIKMPNAIETKKMNTLMHTILDAIRDCCCLDILYMTQGSREAVRRTVEPYGLVFYDGVWILAGYCRLRCEIRSFALDRIQDIITSSLRYATPKRFDLETYFSRSWGFIDDREATVRVRFRREVADYIKRKDQWHPSESRVILPDGSIELTFTVAGTFEIKRWIYTWLPHVEVLEPENLRDEVTRELASALKNYKAYRL